MRVAHITDPGCPFAYSGEPLVTALRWRYGGQLEWRIVPIGLAEGPGEYEARGYTAVWMTQTWLRFRKHGQPFTTQPRARVIATGLACRVVTAAGLESGELARRVLRALHYAWFTTDLLLDEEDDLRRVVDEVEGADGLVDRIGDADVEDAYQAARAEARSAAGSPSAVLGKTAGTDGPERYTAPTLIFESGGRRLEAGGRQPLESYDLLIANLDTTLVRRAPAATAAEAVVEFEHGLTTREVALLMDVDDESALSELIALAGTGEAVRLPLGHDALWLPAERRAFARSAARALELWRVG